MQNALFVIANIITTRAEEMQEGIFFLIHYFARDVLVMKKLKIEKTKPTLLYQF